MPIAYELEPRWDAERFPPALRAPRAVQTARFARDPLGFLRELRARFGPVFSLRLYPNRGGFVCVTDPETTRAVLTDQERFAGGDAAGLIEPVVGPGSLILTPPPKHLRNRKLLLPPFHGERVARWGDRVRELAATQVPDLATGGPVAVRPWAQRLTLDVILRVVFGMADPARAHAFRRALDAVMDPRLNPVLFGPPALRRDLGRYSPGGYFVRRKAVLDDLLNAQIAARRAQPGGDDVLSVLLGAGDFTDDELHDELMGLVLAGHETTATALAWTLHLLAHAPRERDALIDDLDAGSDTLLKATIKESMRLRAPVIDAVRSATADTTLGGHPVPKHAFISAMFCVMHLDPELWPQPDRFLPDRHLDGGAVPYALTPFGGGVRRCLGAALAQLELEVVLREVLAHGVPEPAGPYEAPKLHGVTLVPADGGRIVLRPVR